MRSSPRLLPVLVASFAALAPAGAGAYPQFIALGYTNCATCHYSPTGGGMPNSYGHGATEATFPDTVKVDFLEKLRETLAKPDVSGFDDKHAAKLQADLGLDTRFMGLNTPTDVGEQPSPVFFPMLIEAGGVLAYGPAMLYATVTPRPSGAVHDKYSVVSREHWLAWHLGDEDGVRAGRMTLPFGLRAPDHTLPTREDFGFNKYDQWYALEWDHYSEGFAASVAAFDGTLVAERVEPGERGLAGSYAFNIPSTASVGLSGLAARSAVTDHLGLSLFGRWKIWKTLYTMGELAGQRRMERDALGRTLEEGAYLFRLGAFPIESLDVYAELAGRTYRHARETTKARYMLGVNWKVVPWVELAPALMAEEDVETGLKGSALAQLHVFW